LATPPVARGLSENDFHIFDNGAEQKINYLEESGSSWGPYANQQWFFYHIRGTWGGFPSGPQDILAPTATYTIGYIPSPSQSRDCHTIRVVAGDNDVVLNRDHYCNTEEGETATVEGKKLATQMANFAKSGKRGSIRVSSRPFVFWSSRVLSLMKENPKPGIGAASASASAANYTYVVVVHDSRAPATVQIATKYELERELWDYPCPNHAAIYIFGVVYNTNREVVARFGDSYSQLASISIPAARRNPSLTNPCARPPTPQNMSTTVHLSATLPGAIVSKTKGSRRRRDPLTVAIFLHPLPRECKRLRATYPPPKIVSSCTRSYSRNYRTGSTTRSGS